MAAAALPASVVVLLLLMPNMAAAPWGEEEEEEEEEEASDGGPALQVRMVFLDFRTVRVTWEPGRRNLTFTYRYDDDGEPGQEPHRPCPRYLLDCGGEGGGLACGCVLPGRSELLHFSIGNRTHSLARRSWFVDDYLQPAPPGDVSVTWRGEDAAMLTCRGPGRAGLLFQVQYRGHFDARWQEAAGASESCAVTVEGLDGRRCYEFRVRLRPSDAYYGPGATPSLWTRAATPHGGARHAASCEGDDGAADAGLPGLLTPQRLLVPCVALSLTAVALVLAALRQLPRVKALLLPCVPDPSGSFAGLFDKHRGDFQEWITHAQGAADVAIREASPEEEAAKEEAEAEEEEALVILGEPGGMGEGRAPAETPVVAPAPCGRRGDDPFDGYVTL